MNHLFAISGLFIVALVCLNAFSDSTIAEVESNSLASANYKITEIKLPAVSAEAVGVFSVSSGELLLSANSEVELPIASITKLFTAAATLRSEDLDKDLIIAASDIAAEGQAGKLNAGQTYTPRELLFPLLLESSNDAAAALERVVPEINLAHKKLADASGLSNYNKATVKELAKAVSDLYQTQPYIFDISTLNQYVGEYEGWVNNSPVHALEGYKGGKHGYTEAAGRTLVAIFNEPALANEEIGYILLGSEDLLTDIELLRQTLQNSVSQK